MIEKARSDRRSRFLAARRVGRFRLWMILFVAATAAIVSGALPLDPVQQVLAIYAFELLTIVALWSAYHWHWAPAARHADRRLLEEEPGQVP